MKNTFFVISLLIFLLFFGSTGISNVGKVTISKLEQADPSWLPEWKSDVAIYIDVTVTPHFSGGWLYAGLSDVSIYQGVCGNYGDNMDADLQLLLSAQKPDTSSEERRTDWDEENGQFEIWIPPENDGNVKTFYYLLAVSCFDTAAFGILDVSTSSSIKDDTKALRIPRDTTPKNKIADAWEDTNCNAAQKADITKDAERVDADNNRYKGDGLSIIAEYRGFSEKLTRDEEDNVIDIHHFRCSPSQKDFFAIIEDSLAEDGCGNANDLPKHSCHILSSECVRNPDGPKEGDDADDSRYVNYNNEDLEGYKQVWAIDVITSADIIPSANNRFKLGYASSKAAPSYQSEAIVYTTTLDTHFADDKEALIPNILAHEIGHCVNLGHCPTDDDEDEDDGENAEDEKERDCYMWFLIDTPRDKYYTHHLEDYATTRPHFAPMPGIDAEPVVVNEEEDENNVVNPISTNTGISLDHGCDYNAVNDYCTDTGTCGSPSDFNTNGLCGHRWCICPAAPSFAPTLSITSDSYLPGDALSAVVTCEAPIYGAHLFVRTPGDLSTYGTQIGWFPGTTTTTTLTLPYTFPDTAPGGEYKITARVYPWEGSTYGDPDYLSDYVTVSSPTPVLSFAPSLSVVGSSSYSAGDSLSPVVTCELPIYGAHLFVRTPGDTSTYGTTIGWFSGSTTATSLTLPYTFPTDAASGSYKITARVYPWNGDAWGDPDYLSDYVSVE